MGHTAQGDEGAHIGKRLWLSATQPLSLPAMLSDPSQLARALTWLGGHAISIVVSWRRKGVREGQGGVGRGRGDQSRGAGVSHLPVFGGFIPTPRPGGDRIDHKYTFP